MLDSIPSKAWIDYLLILIIFLLYIINFSRLISLNHTLPKWDEAVHLRDSFVFYNIISDPSQLNFIVIKEIINKSDQYPLLRPSGYYPPLVPVMTALTYFITGISIKAALISNLIVLLILIISVYQIGTYFWNRRTGVLGAILVLLFPIVLHHSIIYYMDLALTAFTALFILALLKTDYFSKTKISLLAGFSFGLGMLTKWTFLFFVLGPLIYLIVAAFKYSSEPNSTVSRRQILKNIFLFGIISFITFGIYYIPIFTELVKETFKYTGGPLSHGPGSILSLESVFFYIVSFWKDMITPFGLILFLSGILILVFSKFKNKYFILLWIILPYFIFTFLIQSKTPRYLMPLLPVITLVISFAVLKISSLLAVQLNYKIPGKYFVFTALLVFVVFYYMEYLQVRESIINSSKKNWNVSGMINAVEKDINTISDKKKILYLGTIPDHEYINGQTLRYFANVKRLPLNVIKLQDYSNDAYTKFKEQFDKYDYILTKSFANIVKPEFQKSVDDMNNFFLSHISGFKLLNSFNEPDGSEVLIYKRKTQ